MIKHILILAFLFSSTYVLSQDLNQVDNQGRKQGKWVVLYEKSRVPQYEGQFKDGKPYGKFTYYYPSKKVKAIMQFEGIISRSLMYEEDGTLMAFGKYVNKEKDSVWTHFAPSGHVSYKETYVKGQLDGKKTIYYIPEDKSQKNQQIAQEFHYSKGKLEGEVREYFPSGVLKTEGKYVNENYEGTVKKYHPNGKLMFLERYKNNWKHGWHIGYDENGKETGRRYYWHGKELKGDKLKAHLMQLKEEGRNPNE
jgi:antitoxin component YwqK of YwqJK toxin-antitoxin module